MPDLQTLDCLQPGLGKLERVKYFNRMLLTADDMQTDQQFVLQKLRRHNRFLHGWGVVCGLIVEAAPTPALPWRVQISEGYALGPFGDEIFVGQAVFLDLATAGPGAATSPCEPGLMLDPAPAAGSEVYVAISYAECNARPVLAMPAGCGCEDEVCEYSRLRDSFTLECLTVFPASHVRDPKTPSLCDFVGGHSLTCIPCPTDPWVVLAKVTLPAIGTPIAATGRIDNRPPIRRIVFSTAVLQKQLIDCCCGDLKPLLLVELSQVFAPGDARSALTYMITVTNQGPGAAKNVKLADTVTTSGVLGLSAVRFENFLADAPAKWTDTTGTSGPRVATIDSFEDGATLNLTFALTYDTGTLFVDAIVQNVVEITSGTALSDQSTLKATLKATLPADVNI